LTNLELDKGKRLLSRVIAPDLDVVAAIHIKNIMKSADNLTIVEVLINAVKKN